MSDDLTAVFTEEELKRHDAAVRLELLNTMSEFTGHVVDYQATEFAIQHPWRCRPDLLSCELMLAIQGLTACPVGDEYGWYETKLVDGEVVVGSRVEPGTDPLMAYLLERYPED